MIYHLIASDISEGEYDHAVSLSCDRNVPDFKAPSQETVEELMI